MTIRSSTPGTSVGTSVRWLARVTLLTLCSLSVGGCNSSSDAEPQVEPELETPTQQSEAPERLAWALALHGGTGTIDRNGNDPEPYFELLGRVLAEGRDRLDDGQAALEVVESLVVLMEDDPLMNAGKGAVLTDRGTHELHASIMDGRSLSAGSVGAVRNVRNPISLARRVMERSPHVLITGTSADQFAREQELRRAPQDYFTTPGKFEQWQAMRRPSAEPVSRPQNTVGVVALDRYGNLAAGSSSGGLMNQRYGRIDAAAIIGAGVYANNASAAVVATGRGEELIRHTVAAALAGRIQFASQELQRAADDVVLESLPRGTGGIVAVDHLGSIAMTFNTAGMFRAAANSSGRFEVGIWSELRSGRTARTPAE